jgi:hypothetical protein
MTRRTGVEGGDGADQGGWAGICINSDGLLNLRLDDYFYGYDPTIGSAPTNAVTFNGQWHQLVAVYSYPTNKLYLDGVNVVTFADNHIMTASDGTRHVWLGSSAYAVSDPGGVAPYRGQMDDVRLYNRALSSNEVAQLYAVESTSFVNFVKAFTVDYSNLIIGSNYQAQASSDLINWTNWGTAFTATSSTYTNSNYQRIDNWNKLFFRLQQQ